ncbi:MAG TPA: glycosyltransferase family 9 protein [Chitinophagaceae bacterium]|nr:glycosyltransferase family 9 protein [Chitinophagaceae bacterium]
MITPIEAKPWNRAYLPKRVLAIRLQAMGDVVITLPYLQALRNMLPADVRIDFLTRGEVGYIPKSLQLFSKVYCIKGGRVFIKQLFYTVLLLPRLLMNRYHVVIDLQNNRLSRLVCNIIRPEAWSAFDRFSPLPAGERTRLTIEAVELGEVTASTCFAFKTNPCINELLKANGWDGISRLVILNPAGAFTTRNWPLLNYVLFAKLWLQYFPSTQFVVAGTSAIAAKAIYMQQQQDIKLINLTGKTTPVQVFAIIQKAWFMLSEDSGLMHMAWVNNIFTIALFGSTRSDWSRPLGEKSLLVSSADLPCGDCMREKCSYGDVHCLTRHTPEIMAEKIMAFLNL